jgi:hypothetical protein
MTFKPRVWQPIAIGLSAINLAAVGFAAGAAEPWHAAVHAGLAVAFGVWAQRLRPGSRGGGQEERLELLEEEMGNVRRELSETQERLDFAERLLAQRTEPHRVGPDQ